MRPVSTTDMHPADIRAAVIKAGHTLADLARKAGLPEYACRQALCGKNRAGEYAIAKVIGKTPEQIWPSRFQRPRWVRRSRGKSSSRLCQK